PSRNRCESLAKLRIRTAGRSASSSAAVTPSKILARASSWMTSTAGGTALQPRFDHLGGVEDLLQGLLVDASLAGQLADRLARPARLLGDLGRLVVTED